MNYSRGNLWLTIISLNYLMFQISKMNYVYNLLKQIFHYLLYSCISFIIVRQDIKSRHEIEDKETRGYFVIDIVHFFVS